MAQPVGGRVWIDDRHPIFRRGLVSCISASGFEVVGESAALNPTPTRAAFDLLVFEAGACDLRDAVIAAEDDASRLVALLPPNADDLVFDLVEAGVAAVLRRSDLAPAALLGALQAALVGTTAIPRELMGHLLDRAGRDTTKSPGGVLSQREMAALQLLSEGYETREIADRLCYSERTVKNIVHDLLMKTNCRNRAHVVAVAARQGLI
jgi:DNA-binding NarL/FixJ family response regulator